MKYLLTLAFLCALTFLSAQDKWQSLFNGKNFDGWTHVGDGSFTIEDGLLKTQGGMGLLYYNKKKIGNARIRVVYKGADANNAGVFIRIPKTPKEAWMPVNRGYEVQIDDREDEYHKTGVLYSLTKAKAQPGKPGEWNTMEITLDGNRTMVQVNGVLVTDYTEGEPVPAKVHDWEPDRGPRKKKGYIGLQNHGGDDVILFREISIQPLKN
ncbi:MAG: DUF1080 domain-containing protein [Lewinella sp.]|nr:DUF1080 domain-containing protein [Lewinella sp.]